MLCSSVTVSAAGRLPPTLGLTDQTLKRYFRAEIPLGQTPWFRHSRRTQVFRRTLFQRRLGLAREAVSNCGG